ncbi:MAG TPA: tetratricopeptide repeat protein [Pyrinomonadaceae bacterium]|nr:tetratricopeptide repeat protein [Pyrinomonadaceae bacterium]
MKKIVFLLILLSTLSLHTFAQTTGEQDIDNTKDPVTSLREQIEGATTPTDRIRLQLKLADLLVSTGHKADALKELQLIADSNTFDPTGFYNLGNSYARLGETESAINAYNTAIEQRKGRYSRAYNNLGVVLLRAGRWDEAYDALLAALKVENFRYAEASYNLGRVYSARGQKDLAAREWRRALVIDPQHDAAAYALSRVGTEDRIVVESPKTTPVKIVEKKPAPAPAAPATAPAAASAPKSLSLDQSSFDFMQRARNAVERGKMSEAVDNFRRVLNRQDGYFPPANLELSYTLLSLKRYDEALPHLLQVSQRDGARYPISYFHLARVYELKGELKLAEAAFVQASPNNPQFLLDVSRVREKLGDFKGALAAVEQYLKLMSDQGEKPSWSDERIAELRRKAGQ